MTIRVCIAGVTGWAGSTLAKSLAQTDDIEIVAGVSRQGAGRSLSDALGAPNLSGVIRASVEEALATPCDVFVEYTKPNVVKANVLTALRHGAHVVIGTSGLTDADYVEINEVAIQAGKGVLAAGNFSMLVTLLQKCAEMVAKYMPQYEIIDYASAGKKRCAQRDSPRIGLPSIPNPAAAGCRPN